MNYFEFYNLPVKFSIDTALLRQKYFEFSKQFHPDFFVNESEEVRQDVLAKSTINNNAFKILGNEALRIKYVLEVTGILTADEKEILPQDFLMEMMELNEAITEMDATNFPKLKAMVEEIEDELKTTLKANCDRYDIENTHHLLQQIKTIYLKQKYLLRIKESMLKFASL